MPQQLPQIPQVDKQTSYQKLKAIVEKLREEFLRAYLFDSASVTVVDNPGKGRSAEVNFPNQGVALTMLEGTRDMGGEPDIPADSYVDVLISVSGMIGTETFCVNTGAQNQYMALIQQWATGSGVMLRFYNRDTVAAGWIGDTIRVRVFQ